MHLQALKQAYDCIESSSPAKNSHQQGRRAILTLLDIASPCPGIPHMECPFVKLALARDALAMLLEQPSGRVRRPRNDTDSAKGRHETALGAALAAVLSEADSGGGMAAAERAIRGLQELVAGWWQEHSEEDFSGRLVCFICNYCIGTRGVEGGGALAAALAEVDSGGGEEAAERASPGLQEERFNERLVRFVSLSFFFAFAAS
jgi:hypothetical protein